MTETGDVTRQLLDSLNRYPGFEDVPGTRLKATEDVDQVQGLVNSWYGKWIKQVGARGHQTLFYTNLISFVQSTSTL